jgi:hypothetical protein
MDFYCNDNCGNVVIPGGGERMELEEASQHKTAHILLYSMTIRGLYVVLVHVSTKRNYGTSILKKRPRKNCVNINALI